MNLHDVVIHQLTNLFLLTDKEKGILRHGGGIPSCGKNGFNCSFFISK